jgi:hypothetical protein
MRGSLRVHSALTLALLLGWSLMAGARERIAPVRIPTSTRAHDRAGPAPARPEQVAPRAIDPKLLN